MNFQRHPLTPHRPHFLRLNSNARVNGPRLRGPLTDAGDGPAPRTPWETRITNMRIGLQNERESRPLRCQWALALAQGALRNSRCESLFRPESALTLVIPVPAAPACAEREADTSPGITFSSRQHRFHRGFRRLHRGFRLLIRHSIQQYTQPATTALERGPLSHTHAFLPDRLPQVLSSGTHASYS